MNSSFGNNNMIKHPARLLNAIFAALVILMGCKEESAHNNAPVASVAPSPNLMFNDSQMKLANITTDIVRSQPLGQRVLLNGQLVADENSIERISARVQGRIEKLYIKDIGTTIQRGQPLYEIYSEALLTIEKEYLLARAQFEALGSTEKRYTSLLAAAERRLMLFGLTKEQIGKLKSPASANPRITFVAPASGVVKSIDVAEGQSVTEGSSLYQLENTATLWLQVALYPGESKLISIGDEVTFRVTNIDKQLRGKVIFLNPEQQTASQVTVMRAVVKNDGTLRSGMQAEVLLGVQKNFGLAVPVDAVIRDQHGAHVYLQRGRNSFQPRMIETGVEDAKSVEVKNGLEEGDTIAITGAYLIYSEYILKRGVDPLASHHHSH